MSIICNPYLPLYEYIPDGDLEAIGVAVSESPAGAYQFYGIVHDERGGEIGKRPGDTVQFDPGVFMDEDGRIYLYSGNGPRIRRHIGKLPKASMVMELSDDMVTVKGEPKKLLPTLGEADDNEFRGHEFFEASSIRKINGKYYLVYSSVNLHELCYAVSDYPDRDFRYGGVLVSNAEIVAGDPLQQIPLNAFGNNHGGIECIDGSYYIFYHRQTNRSMFSRQGCAEAIEVLPDGRIPQVHLTTQGLYGKSLPGEGNYPASSAAVLHGSKQQSISHPLAMGQKHPYITQEGQEVDAGEVLSGKKEAPVSYVTNCKNGFVAVYRYFELAETKELSVVHRGKAKGTLRIFCAPREVGATFGKLGIREGASVKKAGEISLSPEIDWTEKKIPVSFPAGEQELIFTYEGRGRFDLREFGLG